MKLYEKENDTGQMLHYAEETYLSALELYHLTGKDNTDEVLEEIVHDFAFSPEPSDIVYDFTDEAWRLWQLNENQDYRLAVLYAPCGLRRPAAACGAKQ